jgi:transmembrane sensor
VKVAAAPVAESDPLPPQHDAREPEIDEKLDVWLDADVGHRATFEEATRLWIGTNRAAQMRGAQTITLRKAPFYMRHNGRVVLATACAVGIAALTTSLVIGNGWLTGLVTPARAAVYETALGEIRTIRLADGSSLVLDTDTQISISPWRSSYRLAVRRGRVRVQPKSEDRRVLVGTPDRGAEVAGRAFDVSMGGRDLRVAAIDDSVEIVETASGRDTPHRLAPRTAFRVGPGLREVPVASQDLQWVSGMIVLNGTRLEDAIAAINRYNRVKVRLRDDHQRGRTVTGAFRAKDSLGFARAIARMCDLRVVRAGPDKIDLVLPPPGTRIP